MRTAQVAVRKINEWAPGKYKPFTPVQVIVMKELKTGKDINLSLNKKNERRINDWLPAIVVGNVLTVTINKVKDKNGKESEYVDFMGKFSLDRNLDNERSKKNVQSPTSKFESKDIDQTVELTLGTQLSKLEKAIKEAITIYGDIRKEYPQLFN